MEALLLTVLIFGIYLILSERITQFTFKDFEIKLKDTVSKPLEILTKTFSEMCETHEQTKGTEEELESQIIPKLSKEIPDKLSKEVQNSNEKRRIRVLKIQRYGIYDFKVLYIYLHFFYYIVFLDNGKLSGYITAIDMLLIVGDEKRSEFVNSINMWSRSNQELKEPISMEAYVVKGASRKDVLEKMETLGLDVFPVVSADMKYVGMIDRYKIISKINAELSEFARGSQIPS
jgi:CBS domain-containing protein